MLEQPPFQLDPNKLVHEFSNLLLKDITTEKWMQMIYLHSCFEMIEFSLTIQPSKNSEAFAERLSRGPPNVVLIVRIGLVLCCNQCQIWQYNM